MLRAAVGTSRAFNIRRFVGSAGVELDAGEMGQGGNEPEVVILDPLDV